MSGGHCQIVIVKSPISYEILGSSIDDAVGEAFDKVAKMLSLPYPGGPEIELKAKDGDPKSYKLPRSLYGQKNCNFSFSGIKTAVSRIIAKEIESRGNLTPDFIANIAASFQFTVSETLIDRLKFALDQIKTNYPNLNDIVLAGGVADNQYIYQKLKLFTSELGYRLSSPPIALCTDNAAMIAWAAAECDQLGMSSPLDTEPKAHWPLDKL